MLFWKKKSKSASYTEDELVLKNRQFFSWLQEFSKKIVTGAFLTYLVINIFTLFMIYLSFVNSGDAVALDTLIMEANQTFRDVIGGYIIKAATENAIKICGSLIEKYSNYILEKKYNIKSPEKEKLDEALDDPYFDLYNIEEEPEDEEEFLDSDEEEYPEDELKAAYDE